MIKPVASTMPYPTLESIREDVKTAIKLLPIYSGLHGKFYFVSQYVRYYFSLKNLGESEAADLLIDVMATELIHLRILGNVIRKLGINPESISLNVPDYLFKSRASDFSADKIFADLIAGEINSANELKKICGKKLPPAVKDVIERLTLDDELHADVLREKKKFVIKNVK